MLCSGVTSWVPPAQGCQGRGSAKDNLLASDVYLCWPASWGQSGNIFFAAIRKRVSNPFSTPMAMRFLILPSESGTTFFNWKWPAPHLGLVTHRWKNKMSQLLSMLSNFLGNSAIWANGVRWIEIYTVYCVTVVKYKNYKFWNKAASKALGQIVNHLS